MNGRNAYSQATLRVAWLAIIMAAFGTPLTLTAGPPPGGAGTSEDADLKRLFEDEAKRKPAQVKRPTSKSMLQLSDRRGRSYELDFLAAVDLVGAYDREDEHTTDNRFKMREAEIGLTANIDHLARGVVMMAAHNEGGETVFELHEAYFEFPATFIPRTSLKLGKFFYDVGRLNSIHRHDWSFTVAPVVHSELLDEEGVSDTGLEFKVLMPWNGLWQELALGVFNGTTFGHSHTDGETKQNPLFTAHLKQFIHIAGNWGTQFGFSYLRYHPTTNSNLTTQLSGIDLLVKWRKGRAGSFKWQSEVWYRESRQKNERPYDEPAPPVETKVGAYTFFEYQVIENWFAGLRFDGFTDPNKRGDLGYTVRNGTEGISLMGTYRPSEFSYFRLTGERTTDLATGERTYQAYVQATFILGLHPAHTY